MSRKIDIELTSVREDQTWTWRAAGAKQPKGVVGADRLPQGASVGDVLRAEVDTTLDGTEVLSVTPPKTKKESEGRIELIGRDLADDQLVTTTLAPKRGGNRRDRGDRDRGDRPGGRGRGDRGDRRRDGEGRSRRDGERSGGGPDGDRRGRGPREGGNRRPRPERPAPPSRPKAKRLRPARTHRKAALEALAPEEQVIAEQLLRGGVPAVRQAVEKQNEQAKAAGQPLVKADALLAVAERLYPALRVAEWRDRAEAAVADLDELDLRDLRSVVVAAEVGARDDEAKALAEQIKEGLARRVDAEQGAWLTEISETLATGRVVRALRLSSRPPKAGAPLPPDVAAKLIEAASGALTADTVPDRWATVLDALSFSPVRLQVTPASKPETPGEELIGVVTRVAGRLPHIAQEFGITPPPEGAKRRGGRGGSRSRGGAKGSGAPRSDAPRPPKPPKPETDTTPAQAEASSVEAAPTQPDDAVSPTTEVGEAATPEVPSAEAQSTDAQSTEAQTTEAQTTDAPAENASEDGPESA
ncbi:MAG: hypothetical protein GX643_18085 [Acidimicrobiales bacterium]|nr:hypothetical protein [Acidimicrobiales bacterium]